MKVLKFGGSSVARPERIRGIVDILKDYYASGDHFTVVFSAFGGVTDSLIEMSRLAADGDDQYGEAFQAFADRHQQAIADLFPEGELRKETAAQMRKSHDVLKNLLYGIFLVREASTRTMDYVLSFGERSSSYIIAQTLQQAGIPAEYLDARKVLRTDKTFGAAKVNFDKSYEQIRAYYAEHTKVQVVTGFIAAAKGGLTTTLGRGGSDYTASLIAAGLQADAIEIWTDVSGVLTADPRRVKKAFTIPKLSYAEAMEMSHFGAKVIYPPTLMPALHKRIPLYIKNTFDPTFPGTKVSNESNPEDGTAVRGISSINNVALLTLSGSGLFGVPGISARLFGALASDDINIILITQGSSEHAISFAVQPSDADKARTAMEAAFAYEVDRGVVNKVKVERDLSVVAIIGENMRYQPGISGRLFQALGKNGINTVAIAQGSSELNISVVIPKEDENKALNALHEAFFLSDYNTLNLFIVGVGLIGGTLLKQIREQNEYLRTRLGMEIKVVGMANSKKMVFNEDGLELDADWKKQLTSSNTAADLAVFVGRMRDLNLSNAIFVDNTANEKIADYYAGILDESISISTPNKVANSSSYLQYQRLKTIAAKRGVQFHYETNVGAGLPIISTLRDLMDSGDQIRKIEGVLSGSLSFIFNNFDGTRPFHEIVREAKEKGFTEPDPRIDLSGKDVGRKILILARETGVPMETEHIKLIGFLPDGAMEATSVDDFFTVLESNADYFGNLYAKAAAEGKVLRMIATLEGEEASVGVQAVGPDNPFYGLSGSDNMVVFTTDRYNERPLVVRGPGAGAEVTAAGVFAEIIKIGKFPELMSKQKEVRVFAPATVANVAVGYDILGFAINRPGDEIVARFNPDLDGLKITAITGTGDKVLPFDVEKNTAGVAAQRLLEHLGMADVGIELEVHKKMPFGSGLGSSAASSAGAVVAINELLGAPLSRESLLYFTVLGEVVADGSFHADNVAPSLVGGITLIRSNESLDIHKLPVPPNLHVAVIHPNLEILTKDARAVLSDTVPLGTAIHQMGSLASFIVALYTNDLPLLGRSLHDFIIEPQRKQLIKGFDDVKAAAMTRGALGCSISGAGPSMFALCDSGYLAQAVGQGMIEAFAGHGIDSQLYVSPINQEGVVVMK